MAEIKLKKKKPVWPWILLAIVVLGLLGFFLLNDDDDTERLAETTEVQEVQSTDDAEGVQNTNQAEAIEDYVSYLNQNGAQMGLDHEYTHRAFTMLTMAMQSAANGTDFNFDQDWQALNEKADNIREDPLKLTHANTIKDGFQQVVNSFSNIQEAKYPDLNDEVQTLREYSEGMNPDEPTLDQKETVKGFFDQSASILQAMNNQNS
ncbi:hypothetical protein AB9P05_24255 [Roseivirga sp. BDSF3-8]|uniref:hypothetical protein n=1 Tax=Roseivirga sp. BDSF3-8 TaxID=3241598 RepID=UPI00353225AA